MGCTALSLRRERERRGRVRDACGLLSALGEHQVCPKQTAHTEGLPSFAHDFFFFLLSLLAPLEKRYATSTMLRIDDTKQMVDAELAAEQVAEARHYLIELDRKQNQLREAKRKLKVCPEEDVWMLCSASTFVSCELSHEDTVRYLDWQLRNNETAIVQARSDLKEKVAALAALEGPDSALALLYEGFDLKPHHQ